MNRRRQACVQEPIKPKRLDWPEAVVIIIVVAVYAVLAHTGMPLTTVTETLVSGGLFGAHMTRRAHLPSGR
jgi:hypothetical protein